MNTFVQPQHIATSKKATLLSAPVFSQQHSHIRSRAQTKNGEQPIQSSQSTAETIAEGHQFGKIALNHSGPFLIQPKLTIGQPNDKYEQEADRVADQVMQMPDSRTPGHLPYISSSNLPSIQSLCSKYESGIQRQLLKEDKKTLQPKLLANQITPLVQRQTESEEERREEPLQLKTNASQPPNVPASLQNRVSALQGGGQSLPQPEQAFFESRFGADFSHVRIHENSQAADTARAINARAFTVGRNIAFAAGQYQPKTMEGRSLLAHELTHVIQQRNERTKIQRYSKKTLSGKDFRISDDEKMAVRQDGNNKPQRTYYGSKYFYAEPSLIGTSHNRLRSQKSALSLSKEAGLTLTVRPGKPALSNTVTSPRFVGDPRLEAIMLKKRNQYIRWGSTGDAVKKVQQALIDAGHPLPKHGADGIAKGETIIAIKSFQRSVGLTGKSVDGVVGSVTLGYLDQFHGGGSKAAVPAKVLHRISAKNFNTSTEGLSMEIVDDCGGAAKTIMMGAKSGFNTTAPRKGKNIKGVYKVGGVYFDTPDFTTSREVRDYIMMKIMGKSTASSAMTEYWSKTSTERDLIDKEAGINQYAEVKTGESHSIVRGDNIGWNWHWGAVVMQSGSDGVTLENFAGSGNTAWDFQMYATTGPNSFHMEQKKRLQKDLTSLEYGYKPITVRIKPA